MRTCPLLKAIVPFSLTLVAATSLHAPYPQRESIDYMVANADQAVVGRILSVGMEATRYRDGRPMGSAVLSVEKTLKGDPVREPLDLPVASWDYYHRVGSHQLLAALRHYAARPTSIATVDLDAASLAEISGDLVVLETSADVIRAAEDEVRRLPAGEKPLDASDEWPSPGYDVKGDPFYGYRIILPVDERLEKRAHTILRKGPDAQSSLAIHALRFFKSDENIRLLKGALSDTETSIRSYAYQALTGWGIDVPEPLLHN
jgi:hypothetical protein